MNVAFLQFSGGTLRGNGFRLVPDSHRPYRLPA
jgi:hypothetical protein